MPETTIIPPALEPVSLAEMMQWIRLDDDSDEELLQALIATARVAAENYTGRAFITQTRRYTVEGIRGLSEWVPGYYVLPVDYFDAAIPSTIPLPTLPVQAIASVSTYGQDNAATVYPPSNYTVIGNALTLNPGRYWPSSLRTASPGSIDYVAGYGDTPESVPAPIRTAIKMHVAAMHEDRGQCSDDVPAKCQQLLRQYKIDHL